MTRAAIITMVLTIGIVASFFAYFFIKMLRTPSRSELESESE
jgi:hypothetical protein